MRKITKEGLRKKADDLLQDYIRLKYRNVLCLGCGSNSVNVGHHFVTKKNSNALRYYLPNIVPLCGDCHSLIHTQPHLITGRITLRMGGSDWLDDLENTKRNFVKANLGWYQMQYDILKDLFAEENKILPK